MNKVSDFGKSFGEPTLFAGAPCQQNPGERYRLVGANDSWKTTLLTKWRTNVEVGIRVAEACAC